MSKTIPCQKHLFSIPDEITYLNCAYMSPLAKPVMAAGMDGMARKQSPWRIKPEDFFDQSDVVRERFARLINADIRDICILPSVSYGIGIAAKNLITKPGTKTLVLEEQFPSNYYPWLEQVKTASRMVIVKRIAGESWGERILKSLQDDVSVVALPHCHWTDGSLVDLEAVSQVCLEKKIPLVVDATQSLGVLPFDVQKIRPAFLVAATYKWLLGPYNIALMYVAPEYQNGEPLEYNWITRAGSEQFSGVANYTERLSHGATRFDMGERSNFALLPMVASALQLILDWGVDNISTTLGAYNRVIAEEAEKMGFLLPAREHTAPHLMGLRSPGALPSDLADTLAKQNIFVSVRGDAVRVAPHLYNDERDRERFLAALAGR